MRSPLEIWLSLVLLLGLCGCAVKTPLACPDSQPRAAKVFYATDRREDPSSGGSRFGRMRSAPPALHMGWQEVALGPKHRLGRVDPAILMMPAYGQAETLSVPGANPLRRTDAQIAYFANTMLRRAIRSTPPPRPGHPKKVLVFIHGFNTTFPEAVRKTAQLTSDLELLTCDGELRGVPVVYSWPTQGSPLSYLADEENSEWTQQRLAPFLQSLAEVSREEKAELILIAHSMGARALVRSLADLANSCQAQEQQEKIASQVILLAPDIGRGLFNQYVQRFLPLVGHLTIYVSASDRALSISRILHGGHGRLGLMESAVLAALKLTGLQPSDYQRVAYEPAATDSQVDVIDVTGSFASEFGHSYEDPRFIDDLRELIHHGTPAGSEARGNLNWKKIRPDLLLGPANAKMHYFRLNAK